jgi:hypothetical protein
MCWGGAGFVPRQGTIYWKIPPPPGGREYQLKSFGGKKLKGDEKKGENVKEKGRKGKRKRKGEVKG